MRRLSVGFAALVGSLPVVVPAPPTNADTFNRAAAVSYAERWVSDCGGSSCTKLRNPDYYVFGRDCTNYVSQVWNAGGVVYRYYSSPYWYGRLSHGGTTTSWTVADTFGVYMVQYFKLASYRIANQSENYNPAAQGDVILYDNAWGRYGHASVEISWSGSFNYLGKVYAGDYINQHEVDRKHSPWNLGYRVERDPDRRSRYRAVVVHFNG